MYGARAVLKEVVEAHAESGVSVLVVWIPMLATDNKQAARRTGSMFADPRVHQFYDSQRSAGLAFTRDVFPGCLDEAVGATPTDHPLHDVLTEWANRKRGTGPLWDAVLVYSAGIEWTHAAPTPAHWSKQVGFLGGEPGEITGMFFRNACNAPPVDSDWFLEIRRAMAEIF